VPDAVQVGLRSTSPGQAEDVEIIIYNIKGEKVKTLTVTLSGVEGSNGNEGFTPSPSTTLRMTQAGSKTYSITWDGKCDNNKPVSSGIYLYKLRAGKFTATKKMILLR
jgi:flagellar hook assembly protein FlgD